MHHRQHKRVMGAAQNHRVYPRRQHRYQRLLQNVVHRQAVQPPRFDFRHQPHAGIFPNRHALAILAVNRA